MADPLINNVNLKPNKQEITSSDSPYYNDSQFRPYNPDKLYRKKGNYDIYDDMREDDAIKSILMTKKYLMLGNGWTIDIKDEEDPKQIEVKEFLEKALTEDIDIDFNRSLLEMLTCMDFGVSFSEIVWKLEDNQWKVKYIKTRAPHSFRIYQDDFGNITYLEQSQQIKGPVQIKKLDNMIVFPFNMEFDNWYGKSDLKSAYRAWWSKDFIIKAWNIYLDRFGSPLAVGKFDATASEADQKKLQTILNRLQTKTSITIPEGFEVEFIEASKKGEAGYKDAMNSYNTQIARSMLMPDLLGMAGERTSGGSYSLGQTQYDMFLKTLEWTRLELQRKIQRKVVERLVKYNFNIEDIPQFKFKAMSETVKVESLKTWIDLQKTGKYKPSAEEINWARRILGAPEGDVDENDPPPAPIMPGQVPGEKPEKEDGKKLPVKTKDDTKPKEKEEQDEKKMTKGSLRAPIMAEKKQDFAKVNQDQTNTIDTYTKQSSATIATMQEALLQTVKKGRYIENQKLDKVNALELKFTNRLQLDIKSGMREMFKLGKRDAMFELKQERDFKSFAKTDHIDQYIRVEMRPFDDFIGGSLSITDIDLSIGTFCSWGMLKDNTKAVQAYLFIKDDTWTDNKADAYVLNIKDSKPWEVRDYALDEEDTYDLVVKNMPELAVTAINDDILKKVKVVLNNGISQGLSQSVIIGQLKEVFEPYIVAYDGARLDAVIRTNYATAYNQSKMAYFAPAQEAGTIYGYQFSAIMDSRTSDICSGLDNRIFKADNVGDIEPPLHFQCRSTLIPILKDEIENKKIFGASTKENETFFPDDGKFKESKKGLDSYDMRPGGFWVKK